MAGNELVAYKKYLPKIKKESGYEDIFNVKYEHIDDAHFSFDCDFDEKNTIHMTESDKQTEYTDFLDVEFDDYVEENYKPYIMMAVSCGIVTGTLSSIHIDEEKLERLSDWKDSDWKKYIIAASKILGYKGNDLKGALKCILGRGISFVNDHISDEQQQALKDFVSDLAANPSYAGLFFSICTQFSELKYSVDDDGKVQKKTVPDYYAIGNNTSEKLVFAFLYWFFYLITDSVVSRRNILDDLNLTKNLIRIIKELSKEEFVQKIPGNFQDAEKLFSEWLKSLFEERDYVEEDKTNTRFNLQDLIKENLNGIVAQSFCVLLNECMTRASYTVFRIYEQVKKKKLNSLNELGIIDASYVLPFNNRIMSRMLLVSSGVFTGVNIGGATLKALKGMTVNNRKFSETLLTEINLIGIGRFVFACAADCKYWTEDIKISFEKVFGAFDRSKQPNADPNISYFDDTVFEYLVFTPEQARILYSLENLAVSYDIKNTKMSGTASKKKEWQDEWHSMLMSGLEDNADSYFINDEEFLYSGLYELSKDEKSKLWFYLLAVELSLFRAYSPLGGENDKEYKKLKYKNSYIEEQYVVKQTIVSQSEVEAIKKQYGRYKGIVSGDTQALIAGIGVTAAVAVASGGLALAFAPQIAVVIAGEAVAGLHGAALTGASLAYVGGGSLAVGGLGMAGGTAIITGGGVALGLAGSGAASMVAVLAQTSRDYWIRQVSKLLTFSRTILSENGDNSVAVRSISDKLKEASVHAQESLEVIVEQKNDLDKELIKKIKDYVRILEKADKELNKILVEK